MAVYFAVSIKDNGAGEGVTVSSITGNGMTISQIPGATKRQGGAIRIEIWMGVYTASSSVVDPSWTVTLSGSPSTSGGTVGVVFNHSPSPSEPDQVQTNGNTGTALSTGTTGTTTAEEELVLAAFAYNLGDATSSGPDNSFTEVANANISSSHRCVLAYRVVSAVGTYTCGYVIPNSRIWAAAIASVKTARQSRLGMAGVGN